MVAAVALGHVLEQLAGAVVDVAVLVMVAAVAAAVLRWGFGGRR